MISNLLKDHETIIKTLRKNADEAEELEDMATNDFFLQAVEKHEKMAWMLRAHLEARTPLSFFLIFKGKVYDMHMILFDPSQVHFFRYSFCLLFIMIIMLFFITTPVYVGQKNLFGSAYASSNATSRTDPVLVFFLTNPPGISMPREHKFSHRQQ